MTTRNPIEDHLENELPRLRSFGMSATSKERIKLELAAYADLHAARPQGVPSPLSYTLFPASFWRISAALAVLLLAVGGSAYASEDALPGEALYVVKVSVAEPIQTALIPDAKGKAAWHAILAERRLDEATKLAVAGNLDSGTEHFLTANFSSHVENSIAAADQLQDQGDIAGSLNVRSDLEARITAHEDILGQVVNHLTEEGASTSTNVAAQTMLAAVTQKQDAVEGSRLALQDSLTASTEASSAGNDVSAAAPIDTTGPKIAIATRVFAPNHLPVPASAPGVAAQIRTASAVRTMEVASILAKNAPLLDSLASTTAGTSTEATSTEAVNVSAKKDASDAGVQVKDTEVNKK